MQRIFISTIIFFLFIPFVYSDTTCSKWRYWFKPVCVRMQQIWGQGENELYFTGYAWHNRAFYNKERINFYNETAWGGGIGKSFYDEKGNWHGLFTFAFLESHRQVEPIVGYAYLKVLHLTQNANVGAGFTVFLTAHQGIFHHNPFPGALPWLGINYRRVSLSATYIPGKKDVGNVLFLLAKCRF